MDSCNASETCLKCRHCCEHEVFPIGNPPVETLELAWHKGITMFFDVRVERWFLLIERKCMHLGNKGCDIYPTRPFLCRHWMCDYPGKMLERIEVMIQYSNDYLTKKFGER
jgi:Fe-S-cluster containining protein